MVKRYSDFQSFRQDAEAAKAAGRARLARADEWYGYESFDAALSKSLHGDDSTTDKAIALLDKLDTPDTLTRRSITVHSPYGGRVNFSDWMHDSPTPMRRRRRTDLDTAPITIYVSTTSSCAVSAQQILNRGIAILALLLKIQQFRPVDLVLYTDLDGRDDGSTHLLIPIESRPLNLSTAAYCLTSAGYDRHLTHSIGRYLNRFNGGWAHEFQMGSSAYIDTLRKRFSASPDDIFVPSIYIYDQLLTRPVEWINKQLEILGAVEPD